MKNLPFWFHLLDKQSIEMKGNDSSGGKSHFLLDDEFGRQVLAGLNPLSIERLKVIITYYRPQIALV